MTNPLRRKLLLSVPGVLALSSLLPVARAAAPRLRFATLAPRGSLYHRVMLEVGESWRQTAGPDAVFTVFTDGVQGDEPDMVRRMRIGQLSGAMMSVVGLAEIEPGAAALQYMPLMFDSWEEFDAAGESLRPILERRINERGFVVLYWGEAGWVRFFSKVPAVSPADFRRLKLFSWAGSPNQVELMKSLGYQPVVLDNTNVLPGLQTGLIEAVPTLPSWALATQLDSLAPHMLDMRWVPIVGAAVVTRQAWDAAGPEGQAALKRASQQATAELRAQRARSDDGAIEQMRQRGLKVHSLTPAAQSEWHQLVTGVYPRIRGGMVPADMFDAAQQAVADYRAGHSAR